MLGYLYGEMFGSKIASASKKEGDERRHTKFRRRGITQKKAYSIQNAAKF